MINIKLSKVCVSFPIMGFRQDSLKILLLNKLSNKINYPPIANYHALNNINFEINEGDRVGIIGPNGSGKTTLLRLIIGGYYPTSGDINISGRITSLLSLTSGIDENLNGFDNIKVRLKLFNINNPTSSLVSNIVDFAGIGSFINLPFRTYSSGMKARLLFSIATSVDTDIVIMDEWMSVGDADFQLRAEDRLKTYLKNIPIILLASHNINLVNSFANRVIELDSGNIKKDSHLLC